MYVCMYVSYDHYVMFYWKTFSWKLICFPLFGFDLENELEMCRITLNLIFLVFAVDYIKFTQLFITLCKSCSLLFIFIKPVLFLLTEFDLNYTWIKGLEEAFFGATWLLHRSKLYWDQMMNMGELRQIIWLLMMRLGRFGTSLMLQDSAFTRFPRCWRECLRWIQKVCYASVLTFKFDLIHWLSYWWVVIYFGIRNLCK